MAYDWGTHIRSVCALLRADGSGFTPHHTAEDAHGQAVDYLSPSAVRYDLYGANIVVFHRWWDGRKDKPLEQHLELNQKRRDTMLNLFRKAGLPTETQDNPAQALMRYGKGTPWNDIKKLLRSAYTIAAKVSGDSNARSDAQG